MRCSHAVSCANDGFLLLLVVVVVVVVVVVGEELPCESIEVEDAVVEVDGMESMRARAMCWWCVRQRASKGMALFPPPSLKQCA